MIILEFFPIEQIISWGIVLFCSANSSNDLFMPNISTGSPTFLSHFETVASVILSPNAGTNIF